MSRVLAAALISAMTLAASAGLASAATAPTTGDSTVGKGDATVRSTAPAHKVVASTKPVTHKKKVSAAPAPTKTQETTKPHS